MITWSGLTLILVSLIVVTAFVAVFAAAVTSLFVRRGRVSRH